MQRPSSSVSACRRHFTLVEMLVVIAIISILASLLLPSLEGSMEIARRSACSSNARQHAMGVSMYGADYNDMFQPAHASSTTATDNNLGSQMYNGYFSAPLAQTNLGATANYLGGIETFFCPGTTLSDNYWYNIAAYKSINNFNRTTGWNAAWGRYAIGCYNGPIYMLKAYVLRSGKSWRVSAYGGRLPVSVEGWWVGFTDAPAPHRLQGINVGYADGSQRWWDFGNILAVDSLALNERNNFSDGGMHSCCIRFWRVISGMNDLK